MTGVWESTWDWETFHRDGKKYGQGGYIAKSARVVCERVAEVESRMNHVLNYQIRNGWYPNSNKTICLVTVKQWNEGKLTQHKYTVQVKE